MEHNIISVSGGKDSTALLLLAKERGAENMQAVFADTGHEHEQTYEYIAYLNDKVFPIRTVKADFSMQIARKSAFIQAHWQARLSAEMVDGVRRYSDEWITDKIRRAVAILQPTGNPFLDLCLWKGRFPSTKARFCSEELKRNPIISQVQEPLLAAGDDVISWQGVRADESINRRDLPENECKEVHKVTGAELWNFRPILQWTVEDVFAMHDRHGVKPNPLYKQGMGRVGCMPCIHARKSELREIGIRFPREIERVAEWEKLVGEASKRDAATFFASSDLGEKDPAKAYEAGNIYKFIEWSKTARGGRQMLLDPDPSEGGSLCTSIYGLCE